MSRFPGTRPIRLWPRHGCSADKDAKTGHNQLAFITNVDCTLMLRYLLMLRKLQGREKLFHVTYTRLLGAVHSAAEEIGLDSSRFTTHSCRVGGALTLFVQGVSAETIAQRGRWASHTSLSRYLTKGRSQLMNMRFSAENKHVIAVKIDVFKDVKEEAKAMTEDIAVLHAE